MNSLGNAQMKIDECNGIQINEQIKEGIYPVNTRNPR